MKTKLINTTRGWDKERIRVPDKNQTHDLPNIGRAVYPLSCENHWRTRSFVAGVLHTARACTVEVIVGMLLKLGTDKGGTGLWGTFSIRPNIPVWNLRYSMRRMEQHFQVRWINPSQVIWFQVSRENTKSNGGLFYLCLLALGCSIDCTEVEINDVLGVDDNITFIIIIYKESATILRVWYLFIFLTSSRVAFEWRASCSLKWLCSHST